MIASDIGGVQVSGPQFLFVEAWSNKGKAHRNRKEYGEAIKAFDRAIEVFDRTRLEQIDRQAIKTYAITWCEALEAYERARKLDPFSVIVRHNMGLALQALGRTDEAKAAFGEAKILQEMVDGSPRPYIDSPDQGD